MNIIQKSEAIKAGLQKGFQDGGPKMAKRTCYRYTVSPEGELVINPGEANVVTWIFEQYLAGDNLEKISFWQAGEAGHFPPTGKPKWNIVQTMDLE